MNNPRFVNGEYYHVYNRGTDKRTTFMDTPDYQRFLGDLVCFNDVDAPVHSRTRSDALLYAEVEPRQPIVEIAAYCLMPNHYHLLLRQLTDGGITLFMRKLGTGYTMYFNARNARSGVLFQGRYKAKHISNQQYLVHLIHYIHANPTSHSGSVDVEPRKALSATDAHQWSSWHAYCGQRGHSVVQPGETLKLLGGTDYRSDYTDWIQMRDEISREEQSLQID